MSRLLTAEPADVLRCALQLDDAAYGTWTAERAAGRAEAASWRGPAQRSFDAQLSVVRSDLTVISHGQAEMAEVLRAYASELQDAQATARRARQLAADASAPLGPRPTKAQAEQRNALSRATPERWRRTWSCSSCVARPTAASASTPPTPWWSNERVATPRLRRRVDASGP